MTSTTPAPVADQGVVVAARARGARRQAGPGRHLVLVITEDWYYWSHRRALAQAAREAGFRVTLASRFDTLYEDVRAEGVEPLPIRLRRRGRNPLGEIHAIADLASHYRRLRPDIVHHVAIKPVLYGSFAARLAGVPAVVNAISGLGYAFTGKDPKAKIFGTLATAAYRSALRRPGTCTIFQNEDDRTYFVQRGLVEQDQSVLIRGSGVDLHTFRPRALPQGIPTVLYAGRMLWSKGVGDLVAAVPLLRAQGQPFRVILAGHSDSDNPEAIPPDQLRAWEAEGLVEWWGRRDDMAEVMAQAHAVVLASEREGVPKVLLEAAGAGLPLVATDVPGCREVVEHGVNGYLVPVHDASALADALRPLLGDPSLRERMGAASRRIAEASFSEERVIADTLTLYDRLLAGPR